MGKFVNAPIKRHEAFVPLSRDHFTGLAHAHRLIKSAPKDRASRQKALSGFIDAWNAEIAEHFDDEERLFLDYMSQSDAKRFLDEHANLRPLAIEAKELMHSVDPSSERVEIIGQALNNHIRWEERELFGRIEKSLNEEQLSVISQTTAIIESTRARTVSYIRTPNECPGSTDPELRDARPTE